MKVFKIIMNILGIIAASFLSILLVIVLMATPLISAVSAFFEGENVHKILSGIDYAKIIEAEIVETEFSGETELETEIINDLMKSEMMKDVVKLCVDNIFEVVDGNSGADKVTEDDITEIAKEHMDELKKILKDNLGSDIPLTDEILEEMTRAAVKEYSVQIAEMMPTAEDIGLNRDVLNVISNLRNGTYFWIVFAVAAGLTLLVMLCQVMRFKGFMWIGIDYLVAAIGTVILAFSIKVTDFVTLLGEKLIGNSVLSTVTGIISKEMLKGAGILAGCGILFIVVFVVGRKLLKKKSKKI